MRIDNPKRTKCQYCGIKCTSPKSRATHERCWCKSNPKATGKNGLKASKVVNNNLVKADKSVANYLDFSTKVVISLQQALSDLHNLKDTIEKRIVIVEDLLLLMD